MREVKLWSNMDELWTARSSILEASEGGGFKIVPIRHSLGSVVLDVDDIVRMNMTMLADTLVFRASSPY